MDAQSWILGRGYARQTAAGGGAIKGDAGKSAYEIWREAGNTGTQQDFLNSLKGRPAAVDVSKTGTRTEIKVDNVLKATVLDGKNGDDGKSAYDTAVENGFTGTESDRLESLKGEDGNGITDVTKTSTSGLEDTYTGTLSDGRTFTFKVINGANKTKLSEFDNDEEFIKKTVENLVNYYKKSESYSKDEIDDLMRNIGAGLALSIVETLPAADISPTTIYLIKTSEVTTHTDYIYLGDAWVLAENSGVDTSGFEVVEVSNLPASGMLSDKVYRVSVTNTTFAQYIRIGNAWANLGSTGTNLANYYDKAQMTLILSLYVKKDELETALSEYTKTDDLAAVAKSNSYNSLDDKPEIPDPDAFETKAHAEQTYATKEDLEDISQIDDATTSATKTWSSQKTRSEINNVAITVDSALSSTSTNPVQNRAVTSRLDAIRARDILTDANKPSATIASYNQDTLNTPYKQGLSDSSQGIIISYMVKNKETWNGQLAIENGSPKMFIRSAAAQGFADWIQLPTQGVVTTVFNNATVAVKDRTDGLEVTQASLKYVKYGNIVTVHFMGELAGNQVYPVWCALTDTNVMPRPATDEAFGHFIFNSDTSNSSCKVAANGTFCLCRSARKENGVTLGAETLATQKVWASFTYVCK